MKSAIITAATNVIGYKTKQVAKKPWTTEDMFEKMDERRKWKHQTTTEVQTVPEAKQ